LQSENIIFVSGTASIIGHDTQAHNNLQQQLEITVENIRCLLASIDPGSSKPTAVRVYLRHHADMVATHDFLRRHYSESDINIVSADICRDSLLVEIECTSIARNPK
jgi:chorismate lyase/3-hydroxybenzoate synthase